MISSHLQTPAKTPTSTETHVSFSAIGDSTTTISRIRHSCLHYPLPRECIFSDALFSLHTCVKSKNSFLGSGLHAHLLKSGIDGDAFIGNSLLNIYSKFGMMENAEILFDHMPHRTIVTWSTMISGYVHNGFMDKALVLFPQMIERMPPNEFTLAVVLQACAQRGDGELVEAIHSWAIKSGLILDHFLQNSLIDAYAKSGMFKAAERLLLGLYSRDVVSWTSVISACVSHGNPRKALALFCLMQEDGVLPNDVTMFAMLKACLEINNVKIMLWIHAFVLKGNWFRSGLVLNALVEMYSCNGYFHESMTIFRHFCFSNDCLYPSPETVANILQSCGMSGLLELGEEIHGYMIKHGLLHCTVAENSLMNMYARNGRKDSASLLFRRMNARDIISWNTIISCFAKNEHPTGALRLLGEIRAEGSGDAISPDFVTFLAALAACSELAWLIQGQAIQSHLTKTGMLCDIYVQSALIDMYAKCGRPDLAEEIFNQMLDRDISSWNSIIAAYGINGQGPSSVKVFDELVRSGSMKPNAITFVNILAACAHAGLVEEGINIFNSMANHGVRQSMEHFACAVDLLGRAGRIEAAAAFIHQMPIQPGPDVWGALLSASVLAGNMMVSEKAAKELEALEPSNSIWRVALANAYAAAGKWNEAAKIRAEIRGGKKLKKIGGWSSVDVEGCEFRFMAVDTRLAESGLIYETINWLQNHMQDNGTLIELC